MQDLGLFIIGWFFGVCSGVAFYALRNTSKELDETNRIIEQLQIRDDIINEQKATIKALRRGLK